MAAIMSFILISPSFGNNNVSNRLFTQNCCFSFNLLFVLYHASDTALNFVFLPFALGSLLDLALILVRFFYLLPCLGLSHHICQELGGAACCFKFLKLRDR